jgi:hypothetical protein
MKCSNPDCNRGIGLIHYRRGRFTRRHYCSKNCCDAFTAAPPKQSQRERSPESYFEWLFVQPVRGRL